MRKIYLFFILSVLLLNYCKAQVVTTFEMRHITSDPKANGDTDFHGETEWMNLEQRIDFLDKYATFSANFWKNPKLDMPLLKEGEAKTALQNIKPQPLTTVRKTVRLSDWRAYGYRSGKEVEQQQQWKTWTSVAGTSIRDGQLVLKDCRIDRELKKMDWRFRFTTTLKDFNSDCILSFNKNASPLLSLRLNNGKLIAQSGKNKQDGAYATASALRVEIYGDFPSNHFFVSVNGTTVIECPIDNAIAREINHIEISSKGETFIDDLLLFSFVDDNKNKHTPFFTTLLIDENFEKVPSMDGWQTLEYNDKQWSQVTLPSVHGGLREKEESYYLRKKVKVSDFERAILKLETLDPGGEVWINGQPVAVINDRHPYELDVTGYLNKDRENIVAVRVKPYKARHPMLHTPSDHYIGWFLGRTELILTNRCMIKGVYAHTRFIDEDAALQFHNIVLQYRGIYSFKGSVEINYSPWFPTEAPRVASIRQNVEIRPSVDNNVAITLPIEHPDLWETCKPSLYKVEVVLRNEKGEPIDDYVFTTGIRTIEQKNGNVYVNNKPEMLNGAQILGSRYPIETVAKTNRCVSDETVVKDLLMIKKMNGNMLRIHVHAEKDTIDGINDPRYAEYADQMGVYLLWQTAGWIREGEAWNVDFEGYPKYMRQVYNHPSIVMWEASNHPNRFKRHKPSDSHDYMRKIYETISSADTSRLISPTSFWQHTHYGNYDGSMDYKGNPMAPNPVLMEKLMTRGNQDAYTGYGATWTALRKAPYKWAASCLDANEKAFFNFEHEESAAQPNWELAAKEPWYKVQSYEWDYEKGSIGRRLEASEWRISQAFQAFAAWESMKKQILLGYDGFSWCSLESGSNMFTYQKPLVDPFGVPKLAFYANKQVFNRIWAASKNTDVVYGPDDVIVPVVFNLGEKVTVNLTVELKNEKGKVMDKKLIKNILLPAGRSVTTLDEIKFKKVPDGNYFVVYNIRK